MTPELTQAVLRVAIAGGIAGLIGGLIGRVRASIVGSILMGAIGGVSLSAIVRIAGLDPWKQSLTLNAGGGFSYAWAAIGGAFLGYVVTKSSG
jgi:hypothetical protein